MLSKKGGAAIVRLSSSSWPHHLEELLGHVCATFLVDDVGSGEHDLEGDKDEDE